MQKRKRVLIVCGNRDILALTSDIVHQALEDVHIDLRWESTRAIWSLEKEDAYEAVIIDYGILDGKAALVAQAARLRSPPTRIYIFSSCWATDRRNIEAFCKADVYLGLEHISKVADDLRLHLKLREDFVPAP